MEGWQSIARLGWVVFAAFFTCHAAPPCAAATFDEQTAGVANSCTMAKFPAQGTVDDPIKIVGEPNEGRSAARTTSSVDTSGAL